MKIAVFDGRRASPTFGALNEFVVSEKNPGLLNPSTQFVSWLGKYGTSEAIIINMPDRMYDYDQPDALDLPWDSEGAERIVPYRW